MKKIRKIIIGTHNRGKYKEIANLLPIRIKKYSPNRIKNIFGAWLKNLFLLPVKNEKRETKKKKIFENGPKTPKSEKRLYFSAHSWN